MRHQQKQQPQKVVCPKCEKIEITQKQLFYYTSGRSFDPINMRCKNCFQRSIYSQYTKSIKRSQYLEFKKAKQQKKNRNQIKDSSQKGIQQKQVKESMTCHRCYKQVWKPFQNKLNQPYCYYCLLYLFFNQIEQQLKIRCCDKTYSFYKEELEKSSICFQKNSYYGGQLIEQKDHLQFIKLLDLVSNNCIFCCHSNDVQCEKQLYSIHDGLIKFSRNCLIHFQYSMQSLTTQKIFLKNCLKSWNSKKCYICPNKNINPQINTPSEFQNSLCESCNSYYIKNKQLIENQGLISISHYSLHCCVCDQTILHTEKFVQQLFLYQWLDKKPYCNICLVEWFDQIKVQIKKQQKISDVSRQQFQKDCIFDYGKFRFVYRFLFNHFQITCCCCGISIVRLIKQDRVLMLNMKNQSDLILRICLSCHSKYQNKTHTDKSHRFLKFKALKQERGFTNQSQQKIQKQKRQSNKIYKHNYILQSQAKSLDQKEAPQNRDKFSNQTDKANPNQMREFSEPNKVLNYEARKCRSPFKTKEKIENKNQKKNYQLQKQKPQIMVEQSDDSYQEQYKPLQQKLEFKQESPKCLQKIDKQIIKQPIQSCTQQREAKSNYSSVMDHQESQIEIDDLVEQTQNQVEEAYSIDSKLLEVQLSPEVYQNKKSERCKAPSCYNQCRFLLLNFLCEDHFLRYLQGSFDAEGLISKFKQERDQQIGKFSQLETLYNEAQANRE